MNHLTHDLACRTQSGVHTAIWEPLIQSNSVPAIYQIGIGQKPESELVT